jgi:hypothetical protein
MIHHLFYHTNNRCYQVKTIPTPTIFIHVSYRSRFFDTKKKSIFTIMYNNIQLWLNYFNTVTVLIYNIHNYSDRRINQSITNKKRISIYRYY